MLRFASRQAEADRSRQRHAGKQRKAEAGRQRQAGEEAGTKKRSNVRGWGSLGLACKAAKSEHPPRSADTRGDWLKKQVAKTAKNEHPDR